MMPKDPMPRKRGSTEIRSGALLLPALLRSDWQPSSSQLPIILNDARRTSSPGGRYLFAPSAWRCAAIGGFTLEITVSSSGFAHFSGARLSPHAHRAWVPFRAGASSAGGSRLYESHRSGDDLLLPTSPTGLTAPPPPRLPIDISKARRSSSPGGLCFLRRTQSLHA